MHEFFVKLAHLYGRHPFLWTIGILVGTSATSGIVALLLALLLLWAFIYYVVYSIKTLHYYTTKEFLTLKAELADKIAEYNEFDHFMGETREYIKQQQLKLTSQNTRESTLTVYKNSQLDVYKYIVKYFFINKKIDEETMQVMESILQKYNTIDKTYEILSSEYSALIEYIQKHMYRGAYIFKSYTMKKLGSRKLPKFIRDYYMWYSFDYHSPTNRQQHQHKIVLDETRLQDFAQYLNDLIAYRKSVKYQRQLMTPQLREFILSRDDYTCKYCSVSKAGESHLLLEVDHILPIARGGITNEDNLQSLCWKCNRSKGSKVLADASLSA